MAKRKPSGGLPRANEPTGDYLVGYGRPPVSGQFPKGPGGNPRGRPKKPKSGQQDAMVPELSKPVRVVQADGSTKSMPYFEAFWLSIMGAALAKPPDREARRIIVEEMRRQAAVESGVEGRLNELDENAARIALADYVQRLRLRESEEGEATEADEDADNDEPEPGHD